MTAVLEFQHLTKRFGRQTALCDVSFKGKPGQVIALLGENGAGKTTALKILLGLLAPDAGSSSVLGLDSQRYGEEIRRRVGYVPDRPAFYDWMTVAETGWFAAGFYPLGYEARYRELVAEFKLPLDRPLKALSKGMMAKVGLALAMAHDPPLLVLDEPTSGLDPLVRREFLESMVDVAASGRTVLLSSHQIAEVERVADTVLILRKGRLVLSERLEVLKSRVSELIVTEDLPNTAPPRLPTGCALLAAHRDDRQWKLLVRDLTDDGLSELCAAPEYLALESRHPSLEELFVACMRTDGNAEWTFPEVAAPEPSPEANV
jgi:ABC-2 type transport system ATP-binding protein